MHLNKFYGPICQVRDWFDSDFREVIAPCWFESATLPQRVIAPEGEYNRLRSNGGAATLSAATAIATYQWPYGTASNAERFIATLGGSSIEITLPVGGSATLPTARQVCDALKAVPSRHRMHTTAVILCPTPHPTSTTRRTVGGEAGSGTITLFPLTSAITQNDVDNRIMHEIGHNFQGSLWHSGADVATWTAAAARDARSPSTYAQSNSGDDFCEFLIIFNTVRGTLCEPSAQAIFRNRWNQMLTY